MSLRDVFIELLGPQACDWPDALPQVERWADKSLTATGIESYVITEGDADSAAIGTLRVRADQTICITKMPYTNS